MAGPIIEAIKERLDESPSHIESRLENSPLLEEHRERLSEEMDGGGGCCNAATVAEAMRSRGREYR